MAKAFRSAVFMWLTHSTNRFIKPFSVLVDHLESTLKIVIIIGVTSLEKELSEKVKALQKEVEDLTIQRDQATKELNWFKEQIRVGKAKKFAGTTENGKYYEGNLFDEAEAIAEETKESEEPAVEVRSYTRKSKKKKDTSKLPRDVQDHDITDELKEQYGDKLKELAPTIKEEFFWQPEIVKLIQHVTHNYVYQETEDDEPVFISGDNYKKLIDKSMASPSIISAVVHKKFVMGLPLYRIEAEFNRLRIPISRQDMSSWLLICADRYLKYLFEIMREDALKQDILYGDETTVNCLEEKNREASYMWIQRTSPTADRQIALYYYHVSREYDYAKEIYAGFKGYLHADGYGAYTKLPGVTVAACWAHARRKAYEALQAYDIDRIFRKCKTKEERQEVLNNNPAYKRTLELFDLIEELFIADKKIHKDTTDPEEIKARRIKEETSILDRIKKFLDKNRKTFLPKSKSGIAIQYMIDCWDNLQNYLKDGRLELTNNLGERTVKPFVVGRKAWLFANTARGAECSAMIYSIVETAKANNLNTHVYLQYVLDQMRVMDDLENNKDALRALLPYRENSFPNGIKVG